VAYLDGKRPSALFCRGYYNGQSGSGPGRTFIWAVDWRDGKLTQRWTFDTDAAGFSAFIEQGAHSLTIGDVDGDGRDDLVYGAMAVGSDGKSLYNTRLCHGDALHMSDMLPSRPGLEVWMAHESPTCYGNNGLEFRDARNGQLIFGVSGEDSDVGRAVAGDIDPRYAGYEMWGSRGGLMSATGARISAARPGQMNFMAWWDGDLLRELLDKEAIDKWNEAAGTTTRLLTAGDEGAISNNSTKATPNLSADILGDWREEVIWRHTDNSKLLIFTTALPTTYRFPTLMHDPKYRLDVAWQNVGYNQPPHPGYFLGEGMAYPPPLPDIAIAGGPVPIRHGRTLRRLPAGPTPGLYDLNGRRAKPKAGPSLYLIRGDRGGRITVQGL
jgi:rhamnogalacturonan endolyase